jgi:hypothetical protein
MLPEGPASFFGIPNFPLLGQNAAHSYESEEEEEMALYSQTTPHMEERQEDEEEEDHIYEQVAPSRELMPEHVKLNQLNHYLGIESLSAHDKCHLIFEKLLEELTESVQKHLQI